MDAGWNNKKKRAIELINTCLLVNLNRTVKLEIHIQVCVIVVSTVRNRRWILIVVEEGSQKKKKKKSVW